MHRCLSVFPQSSSPRPTVAGWEAGLGAHSGGLHVFPLAGNPLLCPVTQVREAVSPQPTQCPHEVGSPGFQVQNGLGGERSVGEGGSGEPSWTSQRSFSLQQRLCLRDRSPGGQSLVPTPLRWGFSTWAQIFLSIWRPTGLR